MTSAASSGRDLAARARAWRDAVHATVCDRLEPWAHGTVVRTVRYPDYYDYNLVRLERPTTLGVDELVAVVDRELADVAHRRLDVDLLEHGERLRPELVARGWRALRLLWMYHEAPRPGADDVAVREVDFDAVYDLRVSWFGEDFDGTDIARFLPQARAVAQARGSRVLAVYEDGTAIAFAQLERDRENAEISEVYVHPERRGRGLGTAVTRAAIASARDARHLWICADDEDRPKHLYARLGFRPAWTMMQFTRLPERSG